MREVEMGTDARDGIAGQVIAVIRLDDLSQAAPLARALHAGGIVALEYTYTNRAAGAAIAAAREELGDEGIVGAGTVLDAETARAPLLARAQFIVTPTVSLGAIEGC